MMRMLIEWHQKLMGKDTCSSSSSPTAGLCCQEYLYNGQLRGRDCTELVLLLASKSRRSLGAQVCSGCAVFRLGPGDDLVLVAKATRSFFEGCTGERGEVDLRDVVVRCEGIEVALIGFRVSLWHLRCVPQPKMHNFESVGLFLSLSPLADRPKTRESKVAARTIGSPTPMSRRGPFSQRCSAPGDPCEAMEPRYGNP